MFCVRVTFPQAASPSRYPAHCPQRRNHDCPDLDRRDPHSRRRRLPAVHAGSRPPGYADIARNRAVLMLRRLCNDERTEFTMVTIWDRPENTTAFAGPDPEHAVFYPRDEQFLVGRELTVRHYEVYGISGLAGNQPDRREQAGEARVRRRRPR
jgi:hypothetical protein